VVVHIITLHLHHLILTLTLLHLHLHPPEAAEEEEAVVLTITTLRLVTDTTVQHHHHLILLFLIFLSTTTVLRHLPPRLLRLPLSSIQLFSHRSCFCWFDRKKNEAKKERVEITALIYRSRNSQEGSVRLEWGRDHEIPNLPPPWSKGARVCICESRDFLL
jgi:hypothetical protein